MSQTFGKLPKTQLTRSDIEARKALARVKAQLEKTELAEANVDSAMDALKKTAIIGAVGVACLVGMLALVNPFPAPVQPKFDADWYYRQAVGTLGAQVERENRAAAEANQRALRDLGDQKLSLCGQMRRDGTMSFDSALWCNK